MENELARIRRRLTELVELRRIGEMTYRDRLEYEALTDRELELLRASASV